MDLIIEIPCDDSADLAQLKQEHAEDIAMVEASRFDGVTVVQLIVQLSGATIPWIAQYLMARLKAQKEVRIKTDGIEVSGMDVNNATKLLEKLLHEKSSS